MKTLTLTLCLLSLSVISSQVQAQPAPAQPARPKVVPAGRSVAKVTTDRACAIYACNDKAVFSVSVLTDGKLVEEGICHIKLKYDGVEAATEKDCLVSRICVSKVALAALQVHDKERA